MKLWYFTLIFCCCLSCGLSANDQDGTTTTSTPPQPPIPPQPVQGKWTIRAPVTNISCMVISMTAAAIIPYHTVDHVIKNASINVPATAAATGICDPQQQSMTLSWNYNAAGAVTANNTLVFIFSRRHKTSTSVNNDKFALSRAFLKLYTNPVNFPGSLNTTLITAHAPNVSFYGASINKSYRCRPERRIPMKLDIDQNLTAYLVLSNVQLEAFRSRLDEEFDDVEDCEPQGMLTSDLVPIVVGAILGAVFLAALIAYLVGGRRGRQAEYTTL